MNRNDERTAAIFVGLTLAAILFAGIVHALTAAPVLGQGEPDLEAHLVIAQAAVAECGWTDENCHAAGWHVLARRTRLSRGRRTLAETTRAYCASWEPRNRNRKPWVRALEAPGEIAPEPVKWPAGASWSNHVGRWRAVYQRAGAFLRGRIADPCKGGSAVHFGGAMDSPASHWREIECGQVVGQHFYAFGGAK